MLEYKDASGNTVASPTDTGVYAVTATVNDTKFSGSTTGTLTILQAPLTVTANAQTKEYLEANPALTLKYDGFVNSEDKSVFTTQPTVATAADVNSVLGDYGIVVYGSVGANYSHNPCGRHFDSREKHDCRNLGGFIPDLHRVWPGCDGDSSSG